MLFKRENKEVLEEKQDKEKDKIVLHQPLLNRYIHWINVVLLTTIILTGFYISYPFLVGAISMRMVRLIHLTASGLVIATLLIRLYYALITGDYRNFTPRKGDGLRFLRLMSYYFFLSKRKPYHETKYNVGQRLIYSSWLIAFIVEAVTGIALANPTRFDLVARYLGGLQVIRLVHYIFAVYFAATILIHIYLVLTSDPARLQSIFTGYIRIKDGKPEK